MRWTNHCIWSYNFQIDIIACWSSKTLLATALIVSETVSLKQLIFTLFSSAWLSTMGRSVYTSRKCIQRRKALFVCKEWVQLDTVLKSDFFHTLKITMLRVLLSSTQTWYRRRNTDEWKENYIRGALRLLAPTSEWRWEHDCFSRRRPGGWSKRHWPEQGITNLYLLCLS